MTGQPSARTAALDGFLQQAADDLAESHQAPLDQASEGLLFLGARYQSYPAILLRDPFLPATAKIQLLYLMQESGQGRQSAVAMPSLEDTARALGDSRRTAGRDRMLLRVCRWISLCQTVRDTGGRFRGSIYAIHGEPCSLQEGNRLDQGYLSFLDGASANGDPYLQRAAQAAFSGIDRTLDAGRDPLDPPDPVSRRLDAAAAVKNGYGSFYDLFFPEEHSLENDSQPASGTHPTGGHTVATSREADPAAKFAHGEPGAKFAHGKSSPCEKFAHGEHSPCANFAPGYKTIENKGNEQTYPQFAKFAHGYSSSSKTTTTTKTERAERNNSESELDRLIWPSQFDGSQRRLIHRTLVREDIDPDRQQAIVDVLAHKARDADNPLRSPVGYAFKLCKRVHSGQFQPVTPPASSRSKTQEGNGRRSVSSGDAMPKCSDLRADMRRLQSEIDGLEQNLIPMASADNRPRLEASRDRYRQELETLKQRYRALREPSSGTAGDRLACE